MCTLTQKVEASAFFDQVNRATMRLLVLDYEGAIARSVATRKETKSRLSIADLLDAIGSNCNTRVVLIAGRAARDVRRLMGDKCRAEIWGAHGLERLRTDGRYELAFISEDASRAIAEATEMLDQAGLGELCESNLGAIVVHWDGLRRSDVEEIRTLCYQLLAPLACRTNLFLSEFGLGIELRVRGANKGNVLRTLLAEIDNFIPAAYLGNGVNDEGAFDLLQGRGLSVFVHPVFRSTSAQMWLRPDELIQFFSDWVIACGVTHEF